MLIGLIAAVAAGTGVGPGGIGPVQADCGSAGPVGSIEGHRGYAFEGVVRSVVGRDAGVDGWVYRVTIDVTETLAGDPSDVVAFDTGRGPCWSLQGDRYKAGDRLIVTATAPPLTAPVAHLPEALTWRHEWSDRWSFHGLAGPARIQPRALRGATTRDEIVALVAPERLAYRIDADAWRITLTSPGTRLIDVVPWEDGFVALGRRLRDQEGSGPTTLWRSATGESWRQEPEAFAMSSMPPVLDRLVTFHGRLYAFGLASGGLRAWTSTDGIDWTPVDGGAAFATGSVAFLGERAPRAVAEVVASPGRLLVVTGRRSWATTDGVTWTTAEPSGLTATYGDLTAIDDDGFVLRQCLCSRPDEVWQLLWSADGTAWAPVSELPSSSRDIVHDPVRDRLLAATLLLAPDGDRIGVLDARTDDPLVDDPESAEPGAGDATWSRVVTSPGETTLRLGLTILDDTVVLLGNRYAADDRSSWTLVSRDGGTTWTHSPVPGARQPECVTGTAVGTTRIVAFGSCRTAVAWVADR